MPERVLGKERSRPTPSRSIDTSSTAPAVHDSRTAQRLEPKSLQELRMRSLIVQIVQLYRYAQPGKPRGYQQLSFAADHVHGLAPRLTIVVATGVMRLRPLLQDHLRLARFKCRNRWLAFKEETLRTWSSKRARQAAERALPLLVLLCLTAACNFVHGEDSDKQSFSLGPMPELSKTKPTPKVRRAGAPWTYVLSVDHGVRFDQGGKGYFRAPRFHGEHNGLDLLAPIGTPVYAPCTGQVMTGVSQSFGNWARLICPVPDNFVQKGKPHPWVSFFYAHLNGTEFPINQWRDIRSAEKVGEVGKSGNAREASIQPHLHLELIVQHNRRAAMDERHLGADQSNVEAAEHFGRVLSQECMGRYGFEAKLNQLQRARRIDPFIALTCLSDFKPNFKKAPSPLSFASMEWAQLYIAKDFNVNLGVEDSSLAHR